MDTKDMNEKDEEMIQEAELQENVEMEEKWNKLTPEEKAYVLRDKDIKQAIEFGKRMGIADMFRKPPVCTKCGDAILGDEDSLCSGCV